MAKVSLTGPSVDREARRRNPLCMETSVTLTHPQDWKNVDDGEYAVVRLTFLADASHVRRPRTVLPLDAPLTAPAEAKRATAPFGHLDLAETCRALVTDTLRGQLQGVVQRAAYARDSSRHSLRDELKAVIVANAWRPETVGSALEVVRSKNPAKVPIKDRGDVAALIGRVCCTDR
jgi:hypothetical protein